MKKYSFLLLLICEACFSSQDNSNSETLEKCLRQEVEIPKSQELQNSYFVSSVDDNFTLQSISGKFDKKSLSIEEERNIHDDQKNYNYYFKEKNESAVFILGPEKEKGKIILSCVWVESHKFDSKLIYIGQPISYFQNILHFNEDTEKLVVAAGETIVELYFSKGVLYRYRYRNLGYDG